MIHSLFIGRYQPFHAGHKALFDSVLNQGKPICIALRDTPISTTDPYSVQERIAMIRKVYPSDDMVKIVVIPDIDEVCYGRSVGWRVREIRLAEDIENISATKIRNGTLDNRV